MISVSEALSNLELALEDQSAALAMAGRSDDPAECIKLIRRTERSWQNMLAAHRKLIRLAKAQG
ncbi:hypothetical protein LGR54_24600 [Ancylobacter sp. Lp-2]|uniref:hypothetical protein n=1 Tax=Ancylobacter sp. Lp-2 TaxID=2881339 RepID=UPI001E330674|nr:hypothetical protein [Ancylobacter sp. Lp-2]MCB4771796.1 hypothetical protein [Ancylobacter sp. Lp-2]